MVFVPRFSKLLALFWPIIAELAAERGSCLLLFPIHFINDPHLLYTRGSEIAFHQHHLISSRSRGSNSYLVTLFAKIHSNQEEGHKKETSQTCCVQGNKGYSNRGMIETSRASIYVCMHKRCAIVFTQFKNDCIH